MTLRFVARSVISDQMALRHEWGWLKVREIDEMLSA